MQFPYCADLSNPDSLNLKARRQIVKLSMGYYYSGNRIRSQQKTVRPPEELTPQQAEKQLNEQDVLFERKCRYMSQSVQQLTPAKYIDLWLEI